MDTWIGRITSILIILLWTQETYGIIGYDCGSPLSNITTMSLLDIEECDIPLQKIDKSTKYIQLVQVNEFKTVQVRQCKVEIDRTIKKCGMFSHTMDVHNGKYSYIEETPREACNKMHLIGMHRIGDIIINNLAVNQTISRPVTLAGRVDTDGTCHGATYSDPYGTWSDVIVLATVTYTLQEYEANVRVNSNKVILRSGVTCDLGATHCVDVEGGNTYWKPIPSGDSCSISNYGSLYDGLAEVLTDTTAQQPQVIYSLNSQDTVFALTSKGPIWCVDIC